MMEKLKNGYTALVVGGSGGIGSAICDALSFDPKCQRIIGASRSSLPFVDLTDERSIAALADDLRDQDTELDLIFIASGVLDPDGLGPEKSLSALDPKRIERVMCINAYSPVLVLKHMKDLIPRDRPTYSAALSARVGSIGDNGYGGWYGYRASKAALNQLWRSASIELARTHKQHVSLVLHPGTIETDLTRDFANGRFTHSAKACAENLLSVLESKSPEQTGEFFDYAGKPIPW